MAFPDKAAIHELLVFQIDNNFEQIFIWKFCDTNKIYYNDPLENLVNRQMKKKQIRSMAQTILYNMFEISIF